MPVKKVAHYREWVNTKLGSTYVFDEEVANKTYLNVSKINWKDGVANCFYILRDCEEGLDCREIQKRIAYRMKKWRKFGSRYLCMVTPMSARGGICRYEIQYYQKMEDKPTDEFAEDFENVVLRSLEKCEF